MSPLTNLGKQMVSHQL